MSELKSVDVLDGPLAKDLLGFVSTQEYSKCDADLYSSLTSWIEEQSNACSQSVFEFGTGILEAFLQINWTGPPLHIEDSNLTQINENKDIKSDVLGCLERDGDEIYHLLKQPLFILVAKLVLLHNRALFKDCPAVSVWSVKCLATYLDIVGEHTGAHLKLLNSIYNEVEAQSGDPEYLFKDLQAEFYLISCHLYLKLYDYEKAKICLEKSEKLLEFSFSLTASLGKRTKFQQKDLPQMRLDVNRNINRKVEPTREKKHLPKDITLDDDTLLPHIEFINENTKENVKDLQPLEQALILSTCVYLQKSRPRDNLVAEEVTPYVEGVLAWPKQWCVQLKALLLRCLLECNSTRKVERSLKQLESLVETLDDQQPTAGERLELLQCIGLQPRWQVEKSQGKLLLDFGLVDSALQVFERLQLWDDTFVCYYRLGKHGKAEAVARAQLAKRETTTLWCLLGDATMNIEYYEKAWEFSKHRSARAQRSIGLYHLRRQDFALAIPYLARSLELNCLQPGVAFSLGCSYMTEDRMAEACKALRTCCDTDPDNPMAWSNLGSCLIRSNKLPQAYKVFKEASRLSFDNWKIWENFLLISTDLGYFEDAINSVNRLVDLKRKNIDTGVLKILVEVVTTDDINDIHGKSGKTFKDKILKTFAHITSQITSDPYIWESYSKLTLYEADPSQTEKALQLLYKSHRCFTQHTEWKNNEKEVAAVIRVTRKMMTVTKELCGYKEYEMRKVSFYTTTKMCITNLVIRLKKVFSDDLGETFESIQPYITELGDNCTELQTLLHES